MNLKTLKSSLFVAYCDHVSADFLALFSNLHDSELSIENFSFYTSVSAVFSSKIEGESIELDSYVKHKRFGIEFLPDYTQKIDDLYNAYQFAKNEKLNERNIAKAHVILTNHILPENQQGVYRTNNMFVTTDDGKIEYVAALPHLVAVEMQKFYDDIEVLLNENLTIQAVFYYAAMIHLVFVKIHPFNDGNGRTARLVEKWFLAEKLGSKAWFIDSERNYYNFYQTYYHNLRELGLEFDFLNYDKALPFLLLLPNSLKK